MASAAYILLISLKKNKKFVSTITNIKIRKNEVLKREKNKKKEEGGIEIETINYLTI